MGLVQGLAKQGKKATGAIRQPSGGPTFNIKGSAAGGGLSQCIPLTPFSLGLTGDIDCVANAHNLAMVALTSRMQHEFNYDDAILASKNLKRLDIDPRNVQMKWAIDFCAQSLREIVIGLGGKMNGFMMSSGFAITVSSEIMAILSVATGLPDLRERMGRIIVAYNRKGEPVTTSDLDVAGAMTAWMVKAINPNLLQTVEAGDRGFIQDEAKAQTQAGAHYIDVNAGTFVGEEADKLKWIVEAVQEVTELPLSIDSPDAEVIKAVIPLLKKTPLINSITLEPSRIEGILPLVVEHKTKVIALCQSGQGSAETTERKVALAGQLVEKLTGAGVALDDIYIDPLVFPLSTNPQSANATLNAIGEIMKKFPGAHTICGITNVSYGLPARKLVNRAFLAAAITKGLDSAIIDPTDKLLYAMLKAVTLIVGKDDFCMDYIRAFRDGRVE